MAQLMFPDVAGSFQQGFQNGQNMQFNRLAGAAMQNPDQRAQLLGQAGAINPGAALQIQGVYAQQAKQQQADAMKKIGGAARYMLSALQTKDPNQIEGAYQAVRPYLAELGQAQGKTPPPNWDPSMVPAIYQAAAATASAFPDDNKLYNLGPGGRLVNGSGNTVASAPFKPTPPIVNNGYQLTLGPDGKYTAGQIPIGAQNGVGVEQTLAGAIAANKPGTALEQKIALARKMGASDDDIKNMVLGSNAGDSGMELLTPDGKALMDAAIAHGYNMPMPSMGYGKAGTAAKAAAINSLAARFKAAGKSPDEAVSQMIEGNTATSGLRSLQHINAKIGGWEQSAAKQADIALGMSNEVSRTGVPVFNSWLLAGRQATGDVKVAQFNNTVNTLAEEYAKVMSGGGSSAATDSTRALAHKMLNSAMTADQFAGVVAKMRQEMTARTEGLNAAVMSQRNSITSNEGGNMGGWDGQAAQAQPRAVNQQPAPAAAGAPTPGTVEQGYRFKGGDPSNQANWEPVQ